MLAAIKLSIATRAQDEAESLLGAIYSVITIRIAAGVLYPSFGLMLRPEFGALPMSASSISVVSNSLLLRRGCETRRDRIGYRSSQQRQHAERPFDMSSARHAPPITRRHVRTDRHYGPRSRRRAVVPHAVPRLSRVA